MDNISNLVVYNDGELELKISMDNETVWLNQKQLGELFSVESHSVTYHIKNIYKQKELQKNSSTRKIRVVQKEGSRKVEREVDHYNLDMIISIGYRVNSITATKFRQWATSILKNYIQNGYAINGEKIANERFVSLEKDVNLLKNKIDTISSKLEDNSLNIKQGIFYDGQIYDAYSYVNDLIKTANKEIILIDNYIDDTVLTLFSKIPNIKAVIYTNTISKQLQLDFEKYSKQYKNVEIKIFKNSHDRFLILDKKEVYHMGASLKDLGKKWFAFSKMRLDVMDLLGRLD
ncbi:MAG: RhuM family protein [Arcobacteraceae bacterium]